MLYLALAFLRPQVIPAALGLLKVFPWFGQKYGGLRLFWSFTVDLVSNHCPGMPFCPFAKYTWVYTYIHIRTDMILPPLPLLKHYCSWSWKWSRSLKTVGPKSTSRSNGVCAQRHVCTCAVCGSTGRQRRNLKVVCAHKHGTLQGHASNSTTLSRV